MRLSQSTRRCLMPAWCASATDSGPSSWSSSSTQTMSPTWVKSTRLGSRGARWQSSASRVRAGLRACSLAIDAQAWSDHDHDRAAAGALLDAVIPIQTEPLFEFSAEDTATVVVALAEGVALGVLGNAVYDATALLVGRRRPRTRIEIHREMPDGSTRKATVTTDNAEVAEAALRALEEQPPRRDARYEPTSTPVA